ncbi:MAG: polysaccharide biosynthesis tyrosine autokinase [Anaerolineae bacterium]|nr:polysaccharide biosynthesis tyrosine autokinase [Gloeobacterales cyanobacterium ES-bin-313]
MREVETQDTNPTQDLSFYLSAIRNRWWLFSLTGLTCTCLMYVYALSQTPVYESRVRLIRNVTVELPGSSNSGANSNQVSALLDRVGAADEIIRSRSVLKSALEKQKSFNDRDVKFILQHTTATMDKLNPILTVTYQDSTPRRVKALLDALAESFKENDLQSRRSSARQAEQYLTASLPQAKANLVKVQQDYQNYLRRNADISPTKMQEALSSNSLGIDKEVQTQEMTLKGLAGTRNRLVERLGVGEDQALATAALSQDENYQKSIAMLQTYYTQLAVKQTQLQERHPEVLTIKKQIAATEQRLREQADDILSDRLFKGATKPGGTTPSTQLDTTIDVGVRAKSATVKGEALALTLPNPVRFTLTTQLVNAQTSLSTTEASLKALKQAKANVYSKLDGLAEKVVQEQNLLNQVDRSLKVLNNLTERVEFYRLALAQQVTPWSVLEEADLPDFPIAPKPLNNALFGLAVGSVLGFLLAYYLELANNRLRLKEDFQRILGVPMLGLVPFSNVPMNGYLTEEAPRVEPEEELDGISQFFSNVWSFVRREKKTRGAKSSGTYQSALERARIRESFRRIASRLLFSRPNEELRTLCITSCVQSEGKSTCSFWIAHSLADLGKRVLLIDADMRRPSIHEIAQISNNIGLSSLLSSATMTPTQAVRRKNGRLNFDIITAGPIPPNPVALLSSNRFLSVVEALKNEYDMVLIDTPPSASFADSQVIAAFVDAVLFVVSRGTLKAQLLSDAKNNFTPYTNKFVGFVINSTTETKEIDDGFADSYYYNNGQVDSQSAQRNLVADEE